MANNQSPLLNNLINLREISFSTLFNTPSSKVLNPLILNNNPPEDIQLINELKTTANKFKKIAMDKNGNHVDYSILNKSDIYQKYQKNLASKLHNLDLSKLTDPNIALAFWINLYNTLVIHAVIEFRIKNSILEKGPQNLIRFFRRAAYTINGQRFSLEDIEHGVIRGNQGNPFFFTPQFTSKDPRINCVLEKFDPRIHFALNCASRSCPPIAVYSPETLDAQLNTATKNFINNEVELKNNQLWISSIFNWYKSDFNGINGIKRILINHLPENDKRVYWLNNYPNKRFRYSSYNWELNL